MQNNNMKKMLLISPELYTKLKEQINENENLSYMDHEMKKILKNMEMNEYDKWYAYRNMLVKLGNITRQQNMTERFNVPIIVSSPNEYTYSVAAAQEAKNISKDNVESKKKVVRKIKKKYFKRKQTIPPTTTTITHLEQYTPVMSSAQHHVERTPIESPTKYVEQSPVKSAAEYTDHTPSLYNEDIHEYSPSKDIFNANISTDENDEEKEFEYLTPQKKQPEKDYMLINSPDGSVYTVGKNDEEIEEYLQMTDPRNKSKTSTPYGGTDQPSLKKTAEKDYRLIKSPTGGIYTVGKNKEEETKFLQMLRERDEENPGKRRTRVLKPRVLETSPRRTRSRSLLKRPADNSSQMVLAFPPRKKKTTVQTGTNILSWTRFGR